MKKSLLFIYIIGLTTCLQAQSLSLKSKLDEIVNSVPAGTKYAILAYDPVSHDTLYGQNSTLPIKPASNVKLYTSGVALSLMGGDFELSTKIHAMDNAQKNGRLLGNLYLKGYGNSLFTFEDLDKMAAEVKNSGIKEITGGIVGDDSYFDSVYHRSDWIEEERYVDPLPPISAIVLDRNSFNVYVHAISRTKASVSCSPAGGAIILRNNVRVGRGKTNLSVSQSIQSGQYVITVRGLLNRRNANAGLSLHIKYPPLFAAAILHDRLSRLGIRIGKRPSAGIAPANIQTLAQKSVLLKDLCAIVNKRSDNFLAECLFKTLGAVFSSQEGNAFYATQAIMSFLNQKRIFSKGTDIVDGSGLSHFNQSTSKSLVSFLTYIYYDKLIYQDYYNSLSIMGVDGTLRNRLIGTYAENNMHGKTGTLRDVVALAGYLKNRQGRDLIVSIIFEFQSGWSGNYRGIEDQIIRMIAEQE